MIKEEVQLQLGADASKFFSGVNQASGYMDSWVEKVKNIESGYTGWWAKELSKRDALVIASNEKTTAALRASIAEKQAIQLVEIERVKLAQMAANAEIAAQQKSMNDSSFMVLGANKERNAVSTIETGASGIGWFGAKKAADKVKKAGHAAGGFSTVLRESAVIVREGLRGNFTRMIGSFSILIEAIGAVAMAGLAVVGAADAVFELFGGNGIYRQVSSYFKAKSYEKESGKDLEHKVGDASEIQSQRIDSMERAGLIDKKTAGDYRARLKQPGYESVSAVQIELNRIQGGRTVDQIADMPERQRLLDEAAKANKASQRDAMSPQDRLKSDANEWWSKKMALPARDDGSLKYAQDLLEVKRLEKIVTEEEAEATKTLTEEAQKQKDLASEKTKIQQEAALRISEIQQREMEKFMPTLDELASHGSFGSQARAIQRTDRRIKREFESGNVAGAQSDIASRDKIYDSLAARGVVAERSEAREIKDLNKQMAIRLAQMGTKTSPLIIVPNMK